MSEIYGYARVSSRDQNEERQMIALLGFPMERRCIYLDKLSGKDFDRPGYQRLIKKLRPGDVMVIKSIDRLGRDYEEILAEWRRIVKEKGADIVVLDMPLLDTRRRGQDLTGTLIADIVLQLLSYVAETERDFIRSRQAEGIAAARARGVRLGRPLLPVPSGFAAMWEQWRRGLVTGREAARLLDMPYQTFLRRAKKAVGGELFSVDN